jgi:uncharacterized membrane protein YgcG
MFIRFLTPLLIAILTAVVIQPAFAQKWQPGSFTDIKGNKETGFIRTYPSGKGPHKDEAFIEFKQDEKINPIKLSASELQSFMAAQDSFVVAHAPGNETWAGKELDFVKVRLDEEVKLYEGRGGSTGGGRIKPGVSGGFGMGGGGYSGMGGGVGISLGGGGDKSKITYYFGANTAEMQQLTPINFNDIMSDIMADEPEVVEYIRQNKFNLGNIEGLIAFFKKVKEQHKQ